MNGRAPLVDASGLRLPREPYPGLRPFLDFEAALLFGRQRQVREIIERLAATQFVAVLGGSGSGKSSLIHAGVTPELRSYGIPGAGDLWLTMVCTPGTNVSAADRAARRHSPVTRLARRFAKLLKTRGSAAADEARLDEMAEIFRQEGGFARLLDAYGHEFDVPPGPDPADARVLFVIDQFEEVFHPTNKAPVPNEAAVLVERLLDHFFRPHPRCYVVMTMRSEHLNDCAAYLELPDAINKSSFLVRRLDSDDLREAIVGPAQRFLRLMARQYAGTPAGAKLPAQVQFEPAVLDRLLRDVRAITQDPDHLPLLQHMLARLWQAALERDDEMEALVPSHITRADLARAVNASRLGIETGIDDSADAVLTTGINTLRESVHNWPERIYLDHDETNRARLDAIFRRLALKDPNTGHYSQQRIEAGAAAALLDLSGAAGPAGVQELRRLLAEGFLGSVDYLFWDAEDPARVTIKVSHESFIRGWRRFKALVDAEAAQYEQYLAVLRRCAAWAEHGRKREDLLGSGELRRISAGSVQKRRAKRQPFDDWLHLLALDREGPRLAPYTKDLAEFIDESERVESRRRRRRVLWPVLLVSITGIIVGLALPTLFALFIEAPTMRRAELALDASGRTESAEVKRHYKSRAEAVAALVHLLDAAARIDAARSGAGTTFGRTSVQLTEALDGIALVRRQGDFLQGLLSQIEPVVIDKLREVIGTSPLLAAPLPAAPAAAAPESFDGECSVPEITAPSRGRLIVAAASEGAVAAPAATASAASAVSAAVPAAAPSAAAELSGAGSVPSTTRGAGAAMRRALFIPRPEGDTLRVAVYAAMWSPSEGLCRQGPLMLLLDPDGESRAVVDSTLRHLVVLAAHGGSEPVPKAPGQGPVHDVVAQLQTITWRIGPGGELHRAQRATVVAQADPALVARLRAVAGADRLRVVPSWTVPAGRVLDLGGEGLRIVSWHSRRLHGGYAAADFHPAKPAAPETPCGMLGHNMPPVSGWSMRMLDAGQLCLAVYRAPLPRSPEEHGPGGDELGVWAYPQPLPGTLARLAQRPLLPLAAVSPYATVATVASGAVTATTAAPAAATTSTAGNPGVPHEPTWALGLRGELAGWLVLRVPPAAAATPGPAAAAMDDATAAEDTAHERIYGMPLTTCALWRFGRTLLGPQAPPADEATCRDTP